MCVLLLSRLSKTEVPLLEDVQEANTPGCVSIDGVGTTPGNPEPPASPVLASRGQGKPQQVTVNLIRGWGVSVAGSVHQVEGTVLRGAGRSPRTLGPRQWEAFCPGGCLVWAPAECPEGGAHWENSTCPSGPGRPRVQMGMLGRTWLCSVWGLLKPALLTCGV